MQSIYSLHFYFQKQKEVRAGTFEMCGEKKQKQRRDNK